MAHVIWGGVEIPEESHSSSGSLRQAPSPGGRRSKTSCGSWRTEGLFDKVQFKDNSLSGDTSSSTPAGTQSQSFSFPEKDQPAAAAESRTPSASASSTGQLQAQPAAAAERRTPAAIASSTGKPEASFEAVEEEDSEGEGEEDDDDKDDGECRDQVSAELPPRGWEVSVGSTKHAAGKCMPCRYATSGAGCKNGDRCSFCHLDHSKTSSRPNLTKRKKYKIEIDRLEELSQKDPERFAALMATMPRQNAYLRDMLRTRLRQMSEQQGGLRQMSEDSASNVAAAATSRPCGLGWSSTTTGASSSSGFAATEACAFLPAPAIGTTYSGRPGRRIIIMSL